MYSKKEKLEIFLANCPAKQKILQLAFERYCEKEIAEKLNITVDTVGGHCNMIRPMFGANSMDEAADFAYHYGFVTLQYTIRYTPDTTESEELEMYFNAWLKREGKKKK